MTNPNVTVLTDDLRRAQEELAASLRAKVLEPPRSTAVQASTSLPVKGNSQQEGQ